MGRMIPLAEGKHVQGKLTPAQYERLRRAAKKEGLTLQEAVQTALARWSLDVLGEAPWKAFFGCIDGPADAASDIDDIYLED